ncbi:GNAT family N-acetyltransferase [Yoonia sp. R2-816]|uniref:GNAT family N-acetyltransferase n=1 Tax=Yoonia sp. R2-816 TaxID=3342638 RepID=UPI0037294B8C
MSLTDTIITDAASASTEDLCAAMASAFSDYAIPINLTVPTFRFIMKQRGYSPDASRIAIINGQIAAIWLVSVRGEASYLISSGTVPQHRGRGLAKDLAHSALEGLQRRGTMTFQTEVLVENTTAARLYRKLGMRKRRDLSCYTLTGPQPAKENLPPVREIPWSDIADTVNTLRDWGPSWQNSDPSITAIADQVRCFATYDDSTLSGYAVLVPDSGSLMQIGVHPDARRQGIGTALINHALTATPTGQLRLINVDAADHGFAQFMRAVPSEQTQGQFELIMALNDHA